mmetsp:Transcript_4401/g.9774  ORF Transcript_4401/g.9774 Transcript_4401/m.9774 type:complete len:240 (-) Transcript_4401:156-875(-)
MNNGLSEYELLRQERIKRNNERLASLGLLDKPSRPSASATTESKSFSTPKKKKVVSAKFTPPASTRYSRRLSGKPALYKPIEDINDNPVSKPAKVNKRASKRANVSTIRRVIPEVLRAPLTEEQKQHIERKMEGNFLEKFEDYLTNIDALSEGNRRSVMRQITKLFNGQGIRYESKAYGWPEGCYFMKETEIGPTDDILNLMEIGRQCENEWGEDHGNGWLLSHPLKKLYMFQQYYLEN